MAYQPIKVTQITIPGGTSPYVFTVQLINENGTLVDNPNVIQNQQFTRASLTTPFTFQFQLGNGIYSIPNVRFRILYNGEIIKTGPVFTLQVNCSEEQITTDLPSEISFIGITRNNSSRETSLYFTSSKPLSWRISAVGSGIQPQGITIDNQPWNNTTWNPVTTEWAVAPINYIARVNPVSPGQGGLIGGATYYIDLRLNDNPNTVFRMTYTMPNSDITTITDITPIEGGGGGPTCNKAGYVAVEWRGPYASHSAAVTAACADSGTGGLGMFSGGVAVSSVAYASTSVEDCSKLLDGYYYFKIGSSMVMNTGQVSGGTITGLNAFSCDAPSAFDGQVGTRSVIVGDYQYHFVTSANAAVEITGDNKVKISAPYTKPSFNGNSTCYRHIVGDMHQEIKQVDRDALLGAGLDLPEGNHAFFFVYAATGGAPNYNEALNAGQWTMFSDHNILSNGQTARSNNSAQMEAIYISKVKITPYSDNELRAPNELVKLSWLPSFQALGYSIAGLPSHQWVGVTRVLTTESNSAARSAGITRLTNLGVSMQNIYGDTPSSVPISRLWRNIQALVPNYTQDAQAIANAFYQGREQPMMAEVAENVGNRDGCPPCWQVAQQVFQNLHTKAVSQGATSPADHNFCGDYFAHLYGEDNGAQYKTIENGRFIMSTAANARLRSTVPYETDQYSVCGYFHGPIDYRNWMEPHYLDCPIFDNEGRFLYKMIRQIERKFMAAPNRKVMLFTSQSYEGVNMDNIRTGIDFRLRFPSYNGDLIRRGGVGIGYATHFAQCFWGLMFGAAPTFWDVNGFVNIDPSAFYWGMWATDWDGNLTNPSMVKWHADGASVVQWDGNNPAHPPRTPGQAGTFPDRLMGGKNGAIAAAYLYRQLKVIQNRMSTTVEYANFSYTVNGSTSIPGYGNTNVPISGGQGPKINTWGQSNPGQSNAVTIEWNKLPICIYFEGPGGKGVAYQWPVANLSDVQVVTVNNGGGATFTVKGNHPHIFLW